MKKISHKQQKGNIVYAKIDEVKQRIPYKKTVHTLQRRPFLSFFIALGILLLFIIIGSVLRSQNKTEQKTIQATKSVNTFDIGISPRISTQARIEKTGIVKITAQTPGIVQAIPVKEGQKITRGTQLVSLSSNYQGANASALASQIAQKQYQNNKDTYDTQKGIVAKQRDLTNKGQSNTEEIRKIQEQSVRETGDLLRLNQDIVSGIDQDLQTLEANNVNGSNDDLILQTKQLKSQFQSATTQLSNAYRVSDFQTNNSLPKDITNLQKDTALAQLDLQDKAIDLQRDITKIQYQLALINASLMRPASPLSGTVQRIYVRVGQTVQPGTLLAQVSSSEQEITAVANVPADIAKNISQTEESIATLPNQKIIKLQPTFVSSEATDGQLFSVKFIIPKEVEANFTDDQFITILIPISTPENTNSQQFIPLDTIYQTQDQAYVFIAENGFAKVRIVQLGQVYGRFVQVLSGIKKGDKIILNRNVIENDKVHIEN